MKTRLILLGVLIFTVGIGCGNRCGHPGAVTFSCKPVDRGTEGCRGSPDPAATSGRDDVFPVGCRVEFPECLLAYPDSVKTCDCRKLTDSEMPLWWCPV